MNLREVIQSARHIGQGSDLELTPHTKGTLNPTNRDQIFLSLLHVLGALFLRDFFRFELFPYSRSTQQRPNGDCRLGPLAQPTQYSFLLQLRHGRFLQGVENPKNFQESPIARLPGVGCHYTVKRSFMPSCPRQSQMNSHEIPPPIYKIPIMKVRNPYLERMSWANCRRPPDPAAITLAIFLAERNCLINRFTSCTFVPLPRAIRFFRLPLIIVWSRRSRNVIESIIAATRFISRSATCPSIAPLS